MVLGGHIRRRRERQAALARELTAAELHSSPRVRCMVRLVRAELGALILARGVRRAEAIARRKWAADEIAVRAGAEPWLLDRAADEHDVPRIVARLEQRPVVAASSTAVEPRRCAAPRRVAPRGDDPDSACRNGTGPSRGTARAGISESGDYTSLQRSGVAVTRRGGR